MFKCSLQPLLFASLVVVASRAADNPFVGDWKLNPSKSKLTDEMKVENLGANKYAFDFEGNGDPETIVVDGTDQAGHFGTTLSVSVEGPHNWKVVRKKDGRTQVSATWTLSEDNSTLTDDFTFIPAKGTPINVRYGYKRAMPGSGFAATWISTTEAMNSVYVLKIRLYGEDGLALTDPSGQTKNVKFEGNDSPKPAETGNTSSLRRLDEHSLEMTNEVNGKITETRQFEMSSDLKTLTMTRHIKGRTEPQIFVFERQ
jgi:hypothetical protein